MAPKKKLGNDCRKSSTKQQSDSGNAKSQKKEHGSKCSMPPKKKQRSTPAVALAVPEQGQIDAWSIESVAVWLKEQGFTDELCQKFEEQRIDGSTLSSLSEVDLKEELGLVLGDRRRLLRCLKEINKNSQTCASAAGPVASQPMSRPAVPSPCMPTPKGPPLAQHPGLSSAPPAQKPMPWSRPPAATLAKATQPKPGPAITQQPPATQSTSAKGPAHAERSRGPQIFPGLAEAGCSERQMLRCEILDVDQMQAEMGLGGPVHNRALEEAGLQKPETRKLEEAKGRIRKMFERAFHPNTPDPERTQAIRNAKRMMQTHALEEADVQVPERPQVEAGGVFAAKLTPVRRGQKVKMEAWMSLLGKAVSLTFDVGYYHKSVRSDKLMVFYGSCAAAEMAAYAFACAANMIDWMAGGRGLPQDQEFTFGAKHRGDLFSSVLRNDPGYVDWAKRIEREPGGAGNCLQNFIEYARAHQQPAEWDRAYKEGLASTLLDMAKQTQSEQAADPSCQELVKSSKELQMQVLGHFGIYLHRSSGSVTVDGFRQARSSGSRDAAMVDLSQRQIKRDPCLAIEA